MALRLVSLLALAAMGCVCAFAQEKPADASAPAEAKTIDDAKRDFQALKASRAGPDQSTNRLSLPTVELPGVTTEILTPPSVGKNGKKEKRAQQKSKNWLLDAMAQTEKSSGTSDPKNRKRGTDTTAATAFTDELATSDADEDPLSPGDALREQTALTEKVAPVAKDAPILDNPLAPFMSGWISPRDHEVLLPKTSATPMLDASLAQMVDSPGPALALPSTSGPAGGFSTLPPAMSDNPYLKTDLSLPTAALSLPPPSTQLPAAPTLLPEVKSPLMEPGAPAKAAVPPLDLRKPPQDEKYFPQLKRF